MIHQEERLKGYTFTQSIEFDDGRVPQNARVTKANLASLSLTIDMRFKGGGRHRTPHELVGKSA